VTSHVLDHVFDREREIGSCCVAWGEMVLRDQEMPPDELRVVLTTADPEVARRHLELHMERLEEWLVTRGEGCPRSSGSSPKPQGGTG
jgi:hypothetical protein